MYMSFASAAIETIMPLALLSIPVCQADQASVARCLYKVIRCVLVASWADNLVANHVFPWVSIANEVGTMELAVKEATVCFVNELALFLFPRAATTPVALA